MTWEALLKATPILGAIAIQAVLTWARVREQAKRQDELESRIEDLERFVYGGPENLGLASKLEILRQDFDR